MATHPAQALYADVIGVWPAWGTVNDPVPELIVGRAPSHSAEKLTPILHEDYRKDTTTCTDKRTHSEKSLLGRE